MYFNVHRTRPFGTDEYLTVFFYEITSERARKYAFRPAFMFDT